MKKLLVILILTISSTAFGQPDPVALAKYQKTERIGNFLTRWYYDIVGTSLVWKEELTLYPDSTYRYVFLGGDCATSYMSNSGKWTKDDNIIRLNNEQQYRIVKGKLYWREAPEINKHTWVMKKVK